MEYVADLVIALVLLSAIYIGIARGLWGPLLTEGAFVIAFVVDTRVVMPGVANMVGAGPIRTAAGVVVFFVIGIAIRFLAKPVYLALQRLPITRHIDEPAGAIVHGLVGVVLVYLLLGVILDFDRNVYPMLAAGVATAQTRSTTTSRRSRITPTSRGWSTRARSGRRRSRPRPSRFRWTCCARRRVSSTSTSPTSATP